MALSFPIHSNTYYIKRITISGHSTFKREVEHDYRSHYGDSDIPHAGHRPDSRQPAAYPQASYEETRHHCRQGIQVYIFLKLVELV